MRSGHAWILAVILVGALASVAGAGELEDILEASRRATGGNDDTLLQVIVADAHCTGPGGEFETRYSSAPGGNLWFRQKHPGQKPYAALITPEGNWRLNKDGTRDELSPRVFLMVRSHDFQRIALDPSTLARDLTAAGEEEFEGVECRKIEGLVGDGSNAAFFYSSESGLPMGFRMDNPMDPGQPVTIVYREWRDVDGVRLPCVVAALDTQGEFVMDFHTIYFEEVLPPQE